MNQNQRECWDAVSIRSPTLTSPITVIRDAYHGYWPNKDGHRLQTLNVYLPDTEQHRTLAGSDQLKPPFPLTAEGSYWLVYIHGGAWRDPQITASSAEGIAAHTLSSSFQGDSRKIGAVASINYTLSPYPNHSTDPYDPDKGDEGDKAREGHHPQHVVDIITGLCYLRDNFGMQDGQYILVGHSAGATLACQSTVVPATTWTSDKSYPEPPVPAAIFGLNGLYDLPLLVHDASTHAHLVDIYTSFLKIAFGDDEQVWREASPVLFSVDQLRDRSRRGRMPKVIMLAQSKEDQLVPLNQTEAMETTLTKNDLMGVIVARSNLLEGLHNECWEDGSDVVKGVDEILALLQI